jgi:glycosyltransferase involved in cell wall biosynthesis
MEVRRDAQVLDAIASIPEAVRLTVRVARVARTHDLIYATSQKALVVGALAGLVANRPVVWHLHDIMNDAHFSALNRVVSVQLSNHLVDRVFVNSTPTKQAFESCGGDAEKSDVIHYGLDSARFDQVDEGAPPSIRRELSLGEATPLVGVFSRLTPWKGQHVLLRALPTLPDVHALLVGDSLFEDGARYDETLDDLARDLGVRDRVHFLGFRDDIPQLMKAVDIVLHTSTAPEPFGRVIVEGMLARQPVVATRAGGAAEIVDHERTGLLIPPEDEAALASAVQRLLDAPALADRLAEDGYEHACSHFSVAEMNRRIEARIRALL